MASKKLSIGSALGGGFGLFFENFGTMALAYLAFLILWGCGGFLTRILTETVMVHVPILSDHSYQKAASFLMALPLIFLVTGLYLGIVRISLDIVDAQKSSVRRLFSCFHLVLKTWFSVLVPLIILFSAAVLGIILFIIFGALIPKNHLFIFRNILKVIMAIVSIPLFVFVFVKLKFSLQYIVDKNVGAIEALERSYKATSGVWWKLFLFLFITNLLFVTGLLAPIVPMIWVSAYRQLKK